MRRTRSFRQHDAAVYRKELHRKTEESETMMSLHLSTFDYLKPREGQIEVMNALRQAAKEYAAVLEQALDDGPDKTYILRKLRELVMWVDVTLTREANGTPR